MIMTPPTDPAIPTSLVALLLLGISILGGVIAYLFNYYNKRDKGHAMEREAWAKEREAWAVERVVERERFNHARAELRAEYETRYREDYRQLLEQQRQHEEEGRRADADRMETIERTAAEANAKVAQVLEKIYDRYIGPGARRPPH